MLHVRAWERGIRSLYYRLGKRIQHAVFAGGVEADNTTEAPVIQIENKHYDEYRACQ